MPGAVVHLGAVVMCAHGGQALPAAPSPRVFVSGQPVAVMTSPHLIAGCPFIIGTAPVPCVVGQWVTGAGRVLANGAPVILADSQANLRAQRDAAVRRDHADTSTWAREGVMNVDYLPYQTQRGRKGLLADLSPSGFQALATGRKSARRPKEPCSSMLSATGPSSGLFPSRTRTKPCRYCKADRITSPPIFLQTGTGWPTNRTNRAEAKFT